MSISAKCLAIRTTQHAPSPHHSRSVSLPKIQKFRALCFDGPTKGCPTTHGTNPHPSAPIPRCLVHPAAKEIHPVSNQDSPRLRRLLRLTFRPSQTPLGLPVADIAKAEGCTERTCCHDLLLLRKIGLPLQEHSGEHNHKYWRIAPEVQNLKFSLFELLSLCMGRRLLEPFAGTPFFEGIHTVFQRLESQLFSGAALFHAQLAEGFYLSLPGSSDYSTRDQLIDLLLQAVQQQRTLLMDYRKPGGRTLMSLNLRSLHEIKSWVLSFGSQARVLKHSLLVRKVREELQATAKLYRRKNGKHEN